MLFWVMLGWAMTVLSCVEQGRVLSDAQRVTAGHLIPAAVLQEHPGNMQGSNMYTMVQPALLGSVLA